MISLPALGVPAATAILIVFCIVVGVVTLERARTDLFHPLVLVGLILLYYILAPAGYLLATGAFKWPAAYADPVGALAVALLVTFVTYLLILVGYRLVGSVRPTSPLESFDFPSQQTVEPTMLVWLGLAGFVAGLAFYLYYVLINGGFIHLVTAIPRNAFQTVPNTGRYRLLGTAGVFAGLFTICLGLRPRVERNKLSTASYLLLGILIVVTLGVAASLRSRINIVIPTAYILLYFYTTRQISTRTIVGGAAVLTVFGVGFSFLEHIVTGGASTAFLIRGVIDPIRLELFTATIQAVPADHPYQYGATLLWALPIRWAGLPLRYGDQLEVIVIGRNRNHITFPAMMLGELWLNFGPIGLFAGGTLFGGALSAVYGLHRRTSGYLANGLYPLVLLTIIVALPTSIAFAVQSVLFRLCVPVVLAIGVAYGYTRLAGATSWRQSN